MNVAMFGGGKTTFRSVPQEGEQFVAICGGLTIDLSQIQLPESLHLSAVALMGGVEIIVPSDTDVVLSGFSLMGGRDYHRAEDRPVNEYRSVVYLEAVAIMGGVEVREVGDEVPMTMHEAPLA